MYDVRDQFNQKPVIGQKNRFRTVILVIRGRKKSLSVRFHGMYQITMTIDDLINSILD